MERLDDLLLRMRKNGWMVAAHNDYYQDGVFHTFWLFVRGGIAVKGEGVSNIEAVRKAAALTSGGPE